MRARYLNALAATTFTITNCGKTLIDQDDPPTATSDTQLENMTETADKWIRVETLQFRMCEQRVT